MGACGMCIIKIDGQDGYKRSCVTEAENGMSILTSTLKIRPIRRGILELVLAAQPADCLQCIKPGELYIGGKLYTALRAIGMDAVYDTNFSADLTIMEKETEFLERIKEGGPFPLITSCSPGWIKFGEAYYPELLENVSSCKSP